MSGASIGAVVGGAVGFVIGGPAGIQYGIAIGGVAGGLLMPDEVGLEDQYGPRLTNLKTTTSTYGEAINRVYGTSRIGGSILWSNDIEETKHVREEEVGKGGGSESYEVVTYTYSIDMAVAFCEGPVSGIRKIWADSVLIYDNTSGSGISEYTATGQASNFLTIYNGSSTQEVDWFLQANNSDSPAYRNVCYIVFNAFQLEQFGNRIPNITAEIVKDGNYSYEEQEIGVNNYTEEMNSISGYSLGETQIGPTINNSDYFYLTETEDPPGEFIIAKYSTNGLIYYKRYNHGLTGTIYSPLCSGDGIVAAFGTNKTLMNFYLFNENLEVEQTLEIYSDNDPDWFAPGFCAYSDNILIVAATDTSGVEKYDYLLSSNYLSNCNSVNSAKDPRLDAFIQGPDLTDLASDNIMCAGNGKICIFSHLASSVLGAVVRVWDLYTGELIGTVDCNSTTTGDHFSSAPSSTKFIDDNILYSYYSDASSKRGYLLSIDLINLVVIDSISVSYPTNWSANGEFGIHKDGVITSVIRTEGWHTFRLNQSLSSNEVTVSSICQDLMLKSNMDLNEIDLTDTELLKVKGIVINNVSSARSTISILQSVNFFDLVEKDFKIYSKERGSASIKLLENLGVNKKDRIQHKKELLTELPRQVTFRYSNSAIDYQISSQISKRIGGSSNNNLSLDLPMVMSDSKAKKLSELYLFNAWASKDTFQFSLAFEDNIDLNVGDVVSLNYNNEILNIRLLKLMLVTNYTLDCESVIESSYTSTAVGQDTSAGFIPPVLSINLPSNLLVFNAPTLSNSIINSLAVYYVASGQNEGWKGCVLYKSKDSGQTYSDVGVVLREVAFGATSSQLLPGPTETIDLVNKIKITLIAGSLDSITLEHLLNGQNYIKIGDEILQYQTATNIGGNEYELEILLRGRRGTEFAVGTHSYGESFVFLHPSLVNFDFSTLNLERKYKAVTFGTYLDDTNPITHTYDGTNLKPFSPINQTSSYYLPNDNLQIIWMRRDRYISGYLRSLPMSEEIESYNLYIYDNGMTLIRTELVISSSEFTYTPALRVADGLTGDETDEFYYQFSQNSAVVGEGYKSELIKKYGE